MADLGRGFDIDDFRSLMSRKGIARTNLYKLHITPPRGLNWRGLNMPSNQQDVEDICLYCDSVAMPGLSLATTDSKPYGYGPTELKAYMPIFNQLQASFIVDAKGFTLAFFRNWMRGIVNYSGGGKSYGVSKVAATRNGSNYAFEPSYKAEYETNMELNVVSGLVKSSTNTNLNLEIISKTTIVRAFPVMIGDVVMSYGVTDQYMTLPVTFSYFEWYTEDINEAVAQTSQPTGGSAAGTNGGAQVTPDSINALINNNY